MLTFTLRYPSAVVIVAGTILAANGALIATTGQAPPATVSFRVIRTASGPRGSEVGGQFRLEEERTTFSRSRDTQVIVYFQWEGAPGVHRLSGRWRSPNGGIAISEFEYTARDRMFGAYWTLPITPSSPPGTWSLDASIDGLPSGTFTFEIVDSELAPAAAQRRPLAPAELYERASSVFVNIERSTTRAGQIESGAGFVYSPGRIATAFTVMDAIDRVQVVMPSSEREEVTSLVAWNRLQDWAMIPTTTMRSIPLPIAAGDAAKVGDRCYSMAGGAGATRVLSECTIVGQSESTAGGGTRLIANFQGGTSAPGAPVLNEFGEVLGVVGGALSPGPTRLFELLRARAELHGVPIVPLSMFQPPAVPETTSILELRRRNILMAAVNGDANILGSGFARQIQRDTHRPIGLGEEFSVSDGKFAVFLEWEPKERLRGTLMLRAYDDSNQVLTQGKPGKIDFKPGTIGFSQWELSVPSRPGVYRIDVLFGETPIWRGFVRVKP